VVGPSVGAVVEHGAVLRVGEQAIGQWTLERLPCFQPHTRGHLVRNHYQQSPKQQVPKNIHGMKSLSPLSNLPTFNLQLLAVYLKYSTYFGIHLLLLPKKNSYNNNNNNINNSNNNKNT